jgi:hypothetical protein
VFASRAQFACSRTPSALVSAEFAGFAHCGAWCRRIVSHITLHAESTASRLVAIWWIDQTPVARTTNLFLTLAQLRHKIVRSHLGDAARNAAAIGMNAISTNIIRVWVPTQHTVERWLWIPDNLCWIRHEFTWCNYWRFFPMYLDEFDWIFTLPIMIKCNLSKHP